ncbi:hypothetical protein B0T26DRAFT_726240 [Lasiosphaeria miniovina]|uniref:Beta-lactamase-related domain-containing protein n=1 Tax=Lasiosphaeria miniovina TaxID=1954250 RepID=A0AA39ZZB3_9PEZI|nr:uncharacterized protein B0T26DRAFT_726240 [Lasiosphaeria miniovina]KAK0706335.1 hypothetical protein B0T26DRAFT_726240 [Lasiosphaeria miniovina]
MTVRDVATGRVGHGGAVFPRPTALPADRSAYGGEGGYADLSAYAKVLRSLLVDDGKLLAPATAELLFKPLLDPAARAWLNEKTLVHPEWIVGTVPHGVEYDCGAGGLLLDDDGLAENHQHRKRGFLKWGGAWNLFWFIDRAAGAFGVFGSQVLPPADPVVRPLIQAFEEALYSRL